MTQIPRLARARGLSAVPDLPAEKPYALQPIAWDASPDNPHHIAIGDAVEPEHFCGRGCLFHHAAGTGLNMEHATRVEKSTWDPVKTDEHVIHEEAGHSGDYSVGRRYYQLEKPDLDTLRQDVSDGMHSGKCANCGRKIQ